MAVQNRNATYKNPKVLNCHHTFCAPCLQDWYGRGGKGKRGLSCPTCRSHTLVPEDNIDSLPGDFKVRQLADAMKQVDVQVEHVTAPADTGVKCDICRVSDKAITATHYCTQCHENFCLECQEKHNASELLTNHHVVDLSEEVSTTKLFCKEHSAKPIRFICKNCNLFVCTVCVLQGHEDHKVKDLEDGLSETVSSLIDLSNQIKAKLAMFKVRHKELVTINDLQEIDSNVSKEVIESMSEEKRKKLEKFTSDLQASVDGIRGRKENENISREAAMIASKALRVAMESRADINNQVHDEEAKLIDELEDKRKLASKQLLLEIDHIAFHIVNITSLSSHIQELLQRSNMLEILMCHEEATARMNSVLETELPIMPTCTLVSFEPDQGDSILGKIEQIDVPVDKLLEDRMPMLFDSSSDDVTSSRASGTDSRRISQLSDGAASMSSGSHRNSDILIDDVIKEESGEEVFDKPDGPVSLATDSKTTDEEDDSSVQHNSSSETPITEAVLEAEESNQNQSTPSSSNDSGIQLPPVAEETAELIEEVAVANSNCSSVCNSSSSSHNNQNRNQHVELCGSMREGKDDVPRATEPAQRQSSAASRRRAEHRQQPEGGSTSSSSSRRSRNESSSEMSDNKSNEAKLETRQVHIDRNRHKYVNIAQKRVNARTNNGPRAPRPTSTPVDAWHQQVPPRCHDDESRHSARRASDSQTPVEKERSHAASASQHPNGIHSELPSPSKQSTASGAAPALPNRNQHRRVASNPTNNSTLPINGPASTYDDLTARVTTPSEVTILATASNKSPKLLWTKEGSMIHACYTSNRRFSRNSKRKPKPPKSRSGTGPELKYPRDAMFLNNGDVIMADPGDEGELRQPMVTTNAFVTGIQPMCVTQTINGHIAVTDNKVKCIRIYDTQDYRGRCVNTWGKSWFMPMFKHPSGLALTRLGRWIVSDIAKHCVSVHDQEGRVTHQFGTRGSLNVQFDTPRYLTVCNQGRILVSDSGNHCIKAFNFSGQFLHKFGVGALATPCGICIDNRDNVIVADHENDRVLKFSPDGRLIQTLLTDRDVIRPSGIAVNEQNQLVVTQVDNTPMVKVFDITNPS